MAVGPLHAFLRRSQEDATLEELRCPSSQYKFRRNAFRPGLKSLALASLRGYGRRQLWFLGMLEPLLILAAATPCGIVLGLLTSRYLARRWLVPGLRLEKVTAVLRALPKSLRKSFVPVPEQAAECLAELTVKPHPDFF